MSHKLAIINPRTSTAIESTEPLNIMILGTYLKNAGIQVKIIDEVAGDDVVKETKEFSPDLVGFTSTTCSYPRAAQLMKTIKNLGYTTIIGGVHASALPESVLNEGFDMVVVGEGEKTLLKIVSEERQKGIFRTEKADILKAEEIPLPDRTLVNMEFYIRVKDRTPHDPNLDFVPIGAKMATMLSSRGCPFNCIFCHNTWRGIPVRFLRPEVMIEEIERLISHYGIRYIWFLDDEFFLNKSRASSFCEQLIRKRIKIHWATSVRPDSLDEGLVSIAALAGCKRLAFGFESGSQRILDVLNKRSNVEENLAIASLCHKYNIEVSGLIMVGNPTETKYDIKLTRDFIKKSKPDSLCISVLTPFPGTRLWEWCREQGYLPDARRIDFSNFYYTYATIQIPATFSTKEVERIKRNMLIEAYLFNQKMRKRFILKMFKHPIAMLWKILGYFYANKNQ
ncbi:MAG: radical SAM protein [Candidatus Omnitrophota bacterium]